MKYTAKEHKAYDTRRESLKQAEYEHSLKDPPVATWSATMPAYCYTALCPDRELRMRPADWEERGETDG